MGIYPDDKIYGLRWVQNYKVLFEEVFELSKEDEPIIRESIKSAFQEIKDYQPSIPEDAITFQYYAKCWSTYDGIQSHMYWYPIDKETVEKLLV